MFKDKKQNKDTDKFLSQATDDNFIIEEDELDENDWQGERLYAEEMLSMLPAIIDSSLDIAKLVIENRVRNSEKMTDEDIYQIHRKSFHYITNVFAEK